MFSEISIVGLTMETENVTTVATKCMKIQLPVRQDQITVGPVIFWGIGLGCAGQQDEILIETGAGAGRPPKPPLLDATFCRL